MATTLNLKKTLHRPQWEMANPIAVASAAASFVRSLNIPAYRIDQHYFCVNTTSSVYSWDPNGDTEFLLPASGIAGTFGAGSCGRIVPVGPSGTASAGTTSTLTTTLTIPRDLRGYRIRITGGPGAGDERVIASNTTGANAVITVTANFSATITSSSTFQLMTPRLWVFNPAATPGLGFWDWALSAWTAGKSVSGVTFTGTDGLIVSTAGAIGNIMDASDCAGNAAVTSATTTVVTLAGTSTGNSGRSWTTNQWAGAVVQILAGTGSGQTRVISSNTANTFTVSTAFGVAPDSTSVWQITKAFVSSGGASTFSSTTTTVLTVTGSSWTTNQFANMQIRAVGGTGAGQIRTISSNTGTTLTVSAAWTTNFDSTTIWVIEGNDDNLYLLGNNAVAMFKYSISGNTWATATATAARSAAPGAGMSASWVYGVNDSAWTAENTLKNGRYLYSFRGSAGNVLDQYDLSLTTWVSGITYANQSETFTTGCAYEYDGGQKIYIAQAVTGRFFYYDVLLNALESASEHNFPQGAAIVGDKLFIVPYVDGSTTIRFLYHWLNTSQTLVRSMLWNLY